MYVNWQPKARCRQSNRYISARCPAQMLSGDGDSVHRQGAILQANCDKHPTNGIGSIVYCGCLGSSRVEIAEFLIIQPRDQRVVG